MMTTVINGSQLDLYPAIVLNSSSQSSTYQHMYTIKKPYASNDQSDSFVNSSINQNFNLPNNLMANNACPDGQLPPNQNQPSNQPSNQAPNSNTGSTTGQSQPLSQNSQCQNGIGLQSGDGGNRFLDNFKGLFKEEKIEIKKKIMKKNSQYYKYIQLDLVMFKDIDFLGFDQNVIQV